jgi:hypothetical protein
MDYTKTLLHIYNMIYFNFVEKDDDEKVNTVV